MGKIPGIFESLLSWDTHLEKVMVELGYGKASGMVRGVGGCSLEEWLDWEFSAWKNHGEGLWEVREITTGLESVNEEWVVTLS